MITPAAMVKASAQFAVWPKLSQPPCPCAAHLRGSQRVKGSPSLPRRAEISARASSALCASAACVSAATSSSSQAAGRGRAVAEGPAGRERRAAGRVHLVHVAVGQTER